MVTGRINWRKIIEKSRVWPAKIAREAIEKDSEIIILRNGTTPSGIIHIGNANEALRNYLVAICLKELGKNFVFVYSFDDEDPFPKVPAFILNEKGEKVKTSEEIKRELENYLGKPFYLVPDPFGCHESYSKHFEDFYLKDLKALEIEFDTVDNLKEGELKIYFYWKSRQYKEAKELIRKLLENGEKITEILRKFKEKYQAKYPGHVLCRKCGRLLGEILNFDGEYIEYECKDREMKKRVLKGCGNKERIKLEDAELKLPWVPEWTLLDWFYWILKYKNCVIVEPMGKDHYLGSIPPAKEMIKELSKIFNVNVTENNFVWYMYEMFLVNGQKMSGSKGNVYTISDLLKIWEREIIAYFYTKNINKQLNIDLKNAYLIVDEFDRLERDAFRIIGDIVNGKRSEDDLSLDEIDLLANYYLSTFGKIPEKLPKKINYITAAVVGYLYRRDKEKIRRLIEKLMKVEDWEMERIIERCIKASYWLENYAPENIKEKFMIKIQEEKIEIELNETERRIFEDVANYLENLSEWDPERIYNDVCAIVNNYIPPTKENKEKRRQAFAKLYEALIGKNSGPKIGTLIFTIGERSINLIKRYV